MSNKALEVDNSHRISTSQLDMPTRLLLGPGPSNVHPRIREALAMNEVGHLDPTFIELMNETQELLRYVWQTSNKFTIPVSGTGSAAMEATLANCVEPGDVVLIGVNGYFGERLCDMASGTEEMYAVWKSRGEKCLRWKRLGQLGYAPSRHPWSGAWRNVYRRSSSDAGHREALS